MSEGLELWLGSWLGLWLGLLLGLVDRCIITERCINTVHDQYHSQQISWL